MCGVLLLCHSFLHLDSNLSNVFDYLFHFSRYILLHLVLTLSAVVLCPLKRLLRYLAPLPPPPPPQLPLTRGNDIIVEEILPFRKVMVRIYFCKFFPARIQYFGRNGQYGLCNIEEYLRLFYCECAIST